MFINAVERLQKADLWKWWVETRYCGHLNTRYWSTVVIRQSLKILAWSIFPHCEGQKHRVSVRTYPRRSNALGGCRTSQGGCTIPPVSKVSLPPTCSLIISYSIGHILLPLSREHKRSRFVRGLDKARHEKEPNILLEATESLHRPQSIYISTAPLFWNRRAGSQLDIASASDVICICGAKYDCIATGPRERYLRSRQSARIKDLGPDTRARWVSTKVRRSFIRLWDIISWFQDLNQPDIYLTACEVEKRLSPNLPRDRHKICYRVPGMPVCHPPFKKQIQ